MKYALFFLGCMSLLIASCSSDEDPQMMPIEPEPEPEIILPDVIGIYQLLSARDECPDPSQNVTNQGRDGEVCVSAGCAKVTFTLRADSTYNYDQLLTFADGTEDPYIEDGTFKFSQDIITTTSLDGTIIDNFAVEDEGLLLDFFVSEDNNGCRQIWRFSR